MHKYEEESRRTNPRKKEENNEGMGDLFPMYNIKSMTRTLASCIYLE
jgi:hypothetical protein